MKKLLSNYLVSSIIGGAAFWGCYGAIRLVTGSHYGGISVGFLTLLAPFVTWQVVRAWYIKILPEGKRGVLTAILIGIVGPFAFTWLYSIVVIGIPVLRTLQLNTPKDYLSFAGTSFTIGTLSVLTYTGMLGAMVLNIMGSPVMGWWLSKHAKNT
jgi:uncharacterized membrane protein YeaQ/YmgE (transglycosylase-associated protein family)